MADVDDVYSAANVARSRARAAAIRRQVEAGELGPEWAAIPDEMDAYAAEREAMRLEGLA